MKQVILFLSFLLIITGCKKDNTISPEPEDDGVILQEEAIIIDANSNIQLESVEENRLLFSTVNEQLDKIEVGSVLVSGPSDKAPYGYLRKVVGMEKSQGKLILETDDAELTELIKEAKGTFRRTITPDDISRSTNFEDLFKKFLFDSDNNNATVENNLTFEGSHNFTIDFIFDLDIKDAKVNYIKAGFEIENEYNFTVMAGLDVNLDNFKKELELFRHKLKPIVFTVGVVPIVLNSKLYSKVGVSGKIVSGVSGSTWRKITTTAYVEYINKEWKPFNEKEIEEKNFELDAKVGTEIEGFLGIGVEFKFYNSNAAVSDFHIDAYLRGEAGCSAQDSCNKRLKGGLRATGNIKLKLFKKTVVDFTNTLFDVCVVINEEEVPNIETDITPVEVDEEEPNIGTSGDETIDTASDITPVEEEEDSGQPNSGIPIGPNEFVDERDGQVYKWTEIGNQIWMAENLNYEVEGSFCYDNNPANCEKYGRLYSWEAIMQGENSSNSAPSGVKGICPDGWHVPSKSEFLTLIGSYSEDNLHGELKEGGASGLNLLYTGIYEQRTMSFQNIGEQGIYYSSTQKENGNDWAFALNIRKDNNVNYGDFTLQIGSNCRCVKDN